LGTLYSATTRATTAKYTDSSGVETINFGSPVNVFVNYTYQPCFGGSYNTQHIITIPFGASQTTYLYDSSRVVDCGQSNCVTETQTIDCVQAITGQTGVTLYSGSPIAAC
jgi:hypothetical protein